MNILVLSLADLKKINFQRPHHFIKHLSQEHAVTILCVNAWWLKDKKDAMVEDCLKETDFYYLSNDDTSPIWQELTIKKRMNSLKLDICDFDVCINFHCLLAGLILSRQQKIPFIFDICDDLIEWITISDRVPNYLKSLFKGVSKFLIAKNIKLASKITYSLESIRDLYHIPENKSKLVPNGVDIDFFFDRGIQSREKLGIPFDNFVIGFVGFLGEWTKLEMILEINSQLKRDFDIIIVIVGDGPKKIYYEKMCKDLQIKENIIFTGNVQYSKVPEYISIMNICLLPFDISNISQNALPLKLFEYMACKKPIISTPIEGVKSIAGHLVFYSKDENELKNIIQNFFNNPNLMIEMGEKGREFVEKNYNWDTICVSMERTIQTTLKNER